LSSEDSLEIANGREKFQRRRGYRGARQVAFVRPSVAPSPHAATEPNPIRNSKRNHSLSTRRSGWGNSECRIDGTAADTMDTGARTMAPTLCVDHLHQLGNFGEG
jgi:hypothetical protein